MYVCRCLCVFDMGKWSELSLCSVFHKERSVVSGEVKDMSGDVGCVCMLKGCLLYTSPSPRDKRQSRMPSSA